MIEGAKILVIDEVGDLDREAIERALREHAESLTVSEHAVIGHIAGSRSIGSLTQAIVEILGDHHYADVVHNDIEIIPGSRRLAEAMRDEMIRSVEAIKCEPFLERMERVKDWEQRNRQRPKKKGKRKR